MAEQGDATILHATPEAYFADLGRRREHLPRHRGDLNPWAVGCYTSAIRIKQGHRRLENEFYATEKMATTAAAQGRMAYPRAELDEALRDLLLAEFHDILPGSSIQPVEEASLRLLDHGSEIISRLRARTFFALAQGQLRAGAGEIPILVYNPHPFAVQTTVACEFQLPDQNREDTFSLPTVYRGEEALPTQVEQELSNLNLDWRKRVVFLADLAPSQMNRFDCRLQVLPTRPRHALHPAGGRIQFRSDDLEVDINTQTGLIDRYRARGVDYLAPGAFRPLVLADDEDSWGTQVRAFREVIGAFELMSPQQGTRFSGISAGTIESVRVIEDGPVRSVVEAMLGFGCSAICQRYLLPKQGTEIEVETVVHWNEKTRMLKLSIPMRGVDPRYLGQVAYGVAELPRNGDEAVAQKWVAVVSDADDRALTCIDDGIYGSDFSANELRLTLLRSPAYSALPIYDRPLIRQDRYLPRHDQGERHFRFWLNAGRVADRMARVDREALARNEVPFALSFFPAGPGDAPKPGPILAGEAVQLTAFKRAEKDDTLIIRLFEPTGQPRTAVLHLPFLGLKVDLRLGAFEIKTLQLDPATGQVTEVTLMEDQKHDQE